ncbi:unnamed protein product [Lactuca virosa]|uniref:SEC63 domain-containing protein n=1 Tax=Lactuca virosa TaxID=75947 RepID=A0AAU9LVL2_9ASTR|nr:unnamed protein product [Lactuca virosa]
MDLGVHQKTLIDRAYGGERPPLPPLRKYLIHVTYQASAYVVGVAGWAIRLKLSSESVGIEPFSANVAVDGNMVNLGSWDTADLVLTPDFVWKDRWHGAAQRWWILVESHTAHTELLDLKPLLVTVSSQLLENGFSLEEDLDAPPGQRYKMKVVPTSKNITFGVAASEARYQEEACSKIRKSKIGGPVSYGTMVMIHMSYSSILVCMLVTVFLLVLKLADIAPFGYGFYIFNSLTLSLNVNL